MLLVGTRPHSEEETSRLILEMKQSALLALEPDVRVPSYGLKARLEDYEHRRPCEDLVSGTLE